MTESGSKGQTMMAVLTTGSGGYDKLSYQAVAMPEPGPGELLIKVLAAGVNNTDVNTRLGWYSAAVKGGTDETDANSEGWDKGGWNGETPFPFIQGADCCGRVVRPGPGATDALVGKRVLVRSCIRLNGFADMASRWWGVDSNGAFAQYTVAPESEVFAIESDWSDAELATIPCAYGTAENMLHRAGVAAGMTVLVTGASGGVGSAALQLAKRRGAKVITVAGRDKRDFVLGLGADQALAREDDPEAVLGPESVDVVLDLVVGAGFAGLLEVLRRGGTYVTSGAIAGPVVELDIRRVYLKDLRLMGSTTWEEPIFPDLIGYIERGEIRPLLDSTYPLDQIVEAQKAFQEKRHLGKIVLIPPA